MNSASSTFISRFLQSRIVWPLAGLALLLLFNLIFDRAFFEVTTRDGNFYGPMLTVMRLSVVVMLLAMGMTLVIATGGVDLSVGSVMAIVGTLVAFLAVKHHLGFPSLLGVAISVSLSIGAFNGVLISCVGIQPIVVTLIMMVLGRGVALNITGGSPLQVMDSGVLFLGKSFIMGVPVQIFLVLFVFAITVMLCRKTAIGLFVEAVGDNETASRLSGVNARGIKVLVYIFSAVCAALAALVSIGDAGSVDPDGLGQMLELDAITAVVVGGTVLTGGRFTLLGSLIGALLIQTLATTLIRQGMDSAYAPVPKALVILVVCLLQSQKFRAQIASLIGNFRKPTS